VCACLFVCVCECVCVFERVCICLHIHTRSNMCVGMCVRVFAPPGGVCVCYRNMFKISTVSSAIKGCIQAYNCAKKHLLSRYFLANRRATSSDSVLISTSSFYFASLY
jgi:hypothetical protein